MRRRLSMERIWLRRTADWVSRPPSGGVRSTSVGKGGFLNCEVMAATMVMGLYWFEMSFCKIKAGRVFWISVPSVGSKLTR